MFSAGGGCDHAIAARCSESCCQSSFQSTSLSRHAARCSQLVFSQLCSMAVRPGPQTPPIYNGFAEMTVPWSGGWWICGAKLEDEISSAVLHQKLDLDEITAVLRTRRLRWYWYRHVHRATSCINSITRLGLPGTRDRGRPRKTWSACVRNDMTICNVDDVNPLDRNSWRMSVRRCQVLPTPESGTTAAP